MAGNREFKEFREFKVRECLYIFSLSDFAKQKTKVTQEFFER
jgi:hypothetical protein